MIAFYLMSHDIIIIAQIHMTYYNCNSVKQNKTAVIILYFAKPPLYDRNTMSDGWLGSHHPILNSSTEQSDRTRASPGQ